MTGLLKFICWHCTQIHSDPDYCSRCGRTRESNYTRTKADFERSRTEEEMPKTGNGSLSVEIAGRGKIVMKFNHKMARILRQDFKGDLKHVPKERLSAGNSVTFKCTHATILEDRGEGKESKFISSGVSKCHPYDNFSRENGRKRALKRALDNSNFTKDERRQVWEAYFARIPNSPPPSTPLPPAEAAVAVSTLPEVVVDKPVVIPPLPPGLKESIH